MAMTLVWNLRRAAEFLLGGGVRAIDPPDLTAARLAAEGTMPYVFAEHHDVTGLGRDRIGGHVPAWDSEGR